MKSPINWRSLRTRNLSIIADYLNVSSTLPIQEFLDREPVIEFDSTGNITHVESRRVISSPMCGFFKFE
jgi:hypothetical protein